MSVVTPSYNHGRFIEETIRSVLLQGYPNLEYIVMDGGSTDGSFEIIRKYEPWLAYWQHEPDGGQSDAINQGWRRATGEIVAWLNSDDVYQPGAIQRAVEAFRANPSAGLVYGRSIVCDEKSRPTGRKNGRPFAIDEILRGRNPVAQPSAFIRRAALDEIGGLDATLHFAMDLDLWLRIGLKMPVVFVDEDWAMFRFYSESKSGQGRLPFAEDIYRILERAYESAWLPPHLSRLRSAVLAEAAARLAYANYRAARDGPGRRHAWQAIREYPALLRSAYWRPKLMRCLLGRGWARRIAAPHQKPDRA